MAQAAILTRISPARGAASVASSITSGAPKARQTAARIPDSPFWGKVLRSPAGSETQDQIRPRIARSAFNASGAVKRAGFACAWDRRLARRRGIHHAAHHLVEHERADDHDRGESVGPGARTRLRGQ